MRPTDSTIFMGGCLIERDDCLRFVDTIGISSKLDHLRNVSRAVLLSSLTTLDLRTIGLNKHQLHGIENTRTNIETIKLYRCIIEDTSVGDFFASCPKLKCLRFHSGRFESTAANDSLFQRTYSTLERFEYDIGFGN